MQQSQIEFVEPIDLELMPEVRGRLNGMLFGGALTEVKLTVERLPEDFSPERRSFVQKVVESLQDLVDANRQERLVLSGAANLAKQDDAQNGSTELSKIGVLGPTRMNYSGNIASVRAVARYLSQVLEENS